MTQDEYIKSQIALWGEDYVDDLLDRGYVPVQLVMYGKLRWWWIYNGSNQDLTQPEISATLAESRSAVSPVSTETLT